jgi:ribonuclease BN (tRNA processing enzyme)
MKIEVLGAYGGGSAECRMTCLLINGGIALDAGSLIQSLSLERQAEVHSIVLTHSHLDHTNSLPFFIENIFDRREPIDVYASATTIYAIRQHLFNNSTWPDFSRLPNHLLPSVNFHPLENEVPFMVDGVRFTPINVSHLVPTFGFLIEHEGAAVLWSSDTGPTVRLWEVGNLTPHLEAVFVETSFDNELQRIADLSHHLTPNTMRAEIAKLERSVPTFLHHLKPPCVETIRAQVAAMKLPQVELLEQDRVYEFSRQVVGSASEES